MDNWYVRYTVFLNATANILNGEILKFFFRRLGQREQQTERENKNLNDTIYNLNPQRNQLMKDMHGLYSENRKTHVLTVKMPISLNGQSECSLNPDPSGVLFSWGVKTESWLYTVCGHGRAKGQG